MEYMPLRLTMESLLCEFWPKETISMKNPPQKYQSRSLSLNYQRVAYFCRSVVGGILMKFSLGRICIVYRLGMCGVVQCVKLGGRYCIRQPCVCWLLRLRGKCGIRQPCVCWLLRLRGRCVYWSVCVLVPGSQGFMNSDSASWCGWPSIALDINMVLDIEGPIL